MMDMEKVFETSKGSLEMAKKSQESTKEASADDETSNDKESDALERSAEEELQTSQETASSTPDTSKEVFVKFRTIISEYLNGDACSIPEGPVQNVLSSYSLAGYLDHAVPTGKDIVITKLMQQCCFQLQEILKSVSVSYSMQSNHKLSLSPCSVSDGICFVHEESTAAIIQVIQMQLLNLYPKYR